MDQLKHKLKSQKNVCFIYVCVLKFEINKLNCPRKCFFFFFKLQKCVPTKKKDSTVAKNISGLVIREVSRILENDL